TSFRDTLLPSLPPRSRRAIQQQVRDIRWTLAAAARPDQPQARFDVAAKFLVLQKMRLGADNAQSLAHVASAAVRALGLNLDPATVIRPPQNPSFDHRVVDSVIGMGQLRGSGPSSPQQMMPEQRRFVMLMDQADQIMRAPGHDVPPHTDGDPASAADMQHETLVDSIRVTLAWQLHLATPSNATTVPPAAVQ